MSPEVDGLWCIPTSNIREFWFLLIPVDTLLSTFWNFTVLMRMLLQVSDVRHSVIVLQVSKALLFLSSFPSVVWIKLFLHWSVLKFLFLSVISILLLSPSTEPFYFDYCVFQSSFFAEIFHFAICFRSVYTACWSILIRVTFSLVIIWTSVPSWFWHLLTEG